MSPELFHAAARLLFTHKLPILKLSPGVPQHTEVVICGCNLEHYCICILHTNI